ncbi:hypothetical protein NLU13_7183 [Sarocladium strictum]|uniref:GPI mannosyltransferase 2 n=1 Tax=Sarocladium strictum TaxID=5046 RepID=A0AA39GCC6_SARSR|nr:hypothetical protein NLU13_7183 [Sarocladium strictum]
MGVFKLTSTRPIGSIISFFVLFKGFLLCIALTAAFAPDYDTSTSLFFQRNNPEPAVSAFSLAHRLTRWDGIYFVSAAQPNGLLYEQQWAFGPAGLPALVSLLARLCGRTGQGPLAFPSLEPLLAIVISHVSHLAAVLALYHLTLRLSRDVRLALLSSLLHIVSPAGLFLAAPYAESPFACLTLLGHLLAVRSYEASRKADLCLVGAGVVYGVSTLFRSNGLISGMLFAAEAMIAFISFLKTHKPSDIRRLCAAVTGGLFVAAGSIVPQYFAWRVYCGTVVLRPWCSRLIPSIYTFVQEEYWNVGFLRYWTPEQLPLFLLAAPVLYILIRSGAETIRKPSDVVALQEERLKPFVQVLAASQTALALLAITNYHVQIISRISSAYPVWYWWIAHSLIESDRRSTGRVISTFMIMYAGIQGGLFASFLPPA